MRRPSGILFDFDDTILRNEFTGPLAGNRRLIEFAENNSGVTDEEVMFVVEYKFITENGDLLKIRDMCKL